MDQAIERAVERAIGTMQQNLGERLTIDDLARAAMFSKFHFTRIFQQVTGVSPGRFLSAMRLQRAKQLLVSTSLNVADISNLVGYTSVGTFSSRFTRSVGLSPTAYRRFKGFTPQISTGGGEDPRTPAATRIRGCVRSAGPEIQGMVFLGLFPGRIPEGRPVRCAILPRPGPYQLGEVPPGDWYLLAQAIAAGDEEIDECAFTENQALAVGTHGPIVVRREPGTRLIDLQLQPLRVVDPPVLLALLDARKLAVRMRADLERLVAVPSIDSAQPVGVSAHRDWSAA